MEYYTTSKGKNSLSHATTWNNIEDIMFSEISQSQKDKCYMIYSFEVPTVIKFTEAERRMVATRGWGRGGIGNCY
jgi:hypothetical protein